MSTSSRECDPLCGCWAKRTKPKTGTRKDLLLAANTENTRDLSQSSTCLEQQHWESLKLRVHACSRRVLGRGELSIELEQRLRVQALVDRSPKVQKGQRHRPFGSRGLVAEGLRRIFTAETEPAGFTMDLRSLRCCYFSCLITAVSFRIPWFP